MCSTFDRQYEVNQLTRLWQKWRFLAPAGTFLVSQTLLPRIKISGPNHHFRVA